MLMCRKQQKQGDYMKRKGLTHFVIDVIDKQKLEDLSVGLKMNKSKIIRMCIDSLYQENIGLMSAVREASEKISKYTNEAMEKIHENRNHSHM